MSRINESFLSTGLDDCSGVNANDLIVVSRLIGDWKSAGTLDARASCGEVWYSPSGSSPWCSSVGSWCRVVSESAA